MLFVLEKAILKNWEKVHHRRFRTDEYFFKEKKTYFFYIQARIKLLKQISVLHQIH